MITVAIPALNEETRLGLTVENLILAAKDAGNVKLDIIIINDGSTDRTQDVILELEKKYPVVRHIFHEKNKGIGASFREALAIAKYPQFMLTAGDNVVPRELNTKLFRNHKKAEFIVSYAINKEIRTTFRNVLSDLYGLIYMSTYHVYVQYLNSVCIYPTKKLQSFHLVSTRYSMPAELTLKMLLSGCTYGEISGFYNAEAQAKTVSVKWGNLLEVIQTYIALWREIKGYRREVFNKKPQRIILE